VPYIHESAIAILMGIITALISKYVPDWSFRVWTNLLISRMISSSM
jgi:hypothetical protein